MKDLNAAGYANLMRAWVRRGEVTAPRLSEGVLMVGAPRSSKSTGIVYYQRATASGWVVEGTVTPTRRVSEAELRTTTPEDELPDVQWVLNLRVGHDGPSEPVTFDSLATAIAYMYLVYE